ncbi:MAG: AI-2E family transporter [Candidatus Thalassarchaeaceae archaeon]|nr:AI-2E family transporter [Candidatus Thalassarchaeaceae archaeon]
MSELSDQFENRLRTASHAAILLALGVLALLHLRVVIEPFILAVLIFFLLAPGAHWLNDRGVPLFAAYAFVVAALGAIIGIIGWWLYQDITKFADGIPEYTDKLHEKIEYWDDELERAGITITFAGLSDSINSEAIDSLLMSTFGEITNFLSMMFTVFIFLVFIILEAETLPKRLSAAYSTDANEKMNTIIHDIGKGVNKYVVVKTIVSIGTAFVTGACLFAAGVPGWFLWSVLTFILNYVPYIGSLFALIPPLILGFILLSPSIAIALAIILIVNQQIWGQFIENKMFGASLDISPVVLLLVTAFWFWLWGIMGMVLAVPMAVIAKIVLGNIEETRPISILLSERPPSSEEE